MYRLRLSPSAEYDEGKEYVKTSIIVVMVQKVDILYKYTLHRIMCYVMTPRGLVSLATNKGYLNKKELFGTAGFVESVSTTRRIDCRMCMYDRPFPALKVRPS